MTQLLPILVLCGFGLLLAVYLYLTRQPARVSDEQLREWLAFLVKTTASGKRVTTARLPNEVYDKIALMRTPKQRAEWQEVVERLENEFAVRTIETQVFIRKQANGIKLTEADEIIRQREGLAGYTGEPPKRRRTKPDTDEPPVLDLKAALEQKDNATEGASADAPTHQD